MVLIVLFKGNKFLEDGIYIGRRFFGRVILNKNGFCGMVRIMFSILDEYFFYISNFLCCEYYIVIFWWIFGWLGVFLDGMYRMLYNMRIRECMRLNVLYLVFVSI